MTSNTTTNKHKKKSYLLAIVAENCRRLEQPTLVATNDSPKQQSTLYRWHFSLQHKQSKKQLFTSLEHNNNDNDKPLADRGEIKPR
jgi:hypothetical protein